MSTGMLNVIFISCIARVTMEPLKKSSYKQLQVAIIINIPFHSPDSNVSSP